MSYTDAGAGFTSSWAPNSPWKDHVSRMLERGVLKGHIGCVSTQKDSINYIVLEILGYFSKNRP